MKHNSNEYVSEFCHVTYQENDNVVLLTWKKFCCFEEYRTPVRFALSLLEQNRNSNMVIDARNGFEDEKQDVEWGFSEFIPALAQTECKIVALIINEVNDIEDEMDMWSKEFGKYFVVQKSETYQDAISKIKQ